MAEAILKSFDPELEIYSAGLDPADHISPIAIDVMKEVGIELQPCLPRKFEEFKDIAFDFLITVCEGTHEELKVPDIRFKKKLHLGIRSPYRNSHSHDEIREKCRKVRDELLLEMDYFYHHMVKPEMTERST